MTIVLLFLAGVFTEALVTAQTLAISKRRAVVAAIIAYVAWSLWGTLLSEFVVNPLNVQPFAIGAALGTYIVTRRQHAPS